MDRMIQVRWLHPSPGAVNVRAWDADANWIGHAEKPRRRLEDRGDLGMLLTESAEHGPSVARP
jgi:hypothetical protein